MELTLKELAPYLPYGLRYSFDNYKYWGIEKQENNTSPRYDLGTLVRIGKKEYIYPIAVEWDDPKNGLAGTFKFENDNFKPILRPMSDLHDINLKWKELALENTVNNNDQYLVERDFKTSISNISYSFSQWLISNHFDIFRLIDKGLAIDINTINQ